MKKILLALLFLVACMPVAHAFGSAKDRIDGVTEFLIERANENYLYFFENSIKENKDLKCYFGKTVANLELGGLKELMMSNGLWRDSLGKDFEGIKNKATIWVVSNALDQVDSTINRLLNLDNEKLEELKDKKVLTSTLNMLSQEDKKNVIKAAIEYFVKYQSANSIELKNKLCAVGADDTADLKKHIEILKSISDVFKADIHAIDSEQKKNALLIVAGVSMGAVVISKVDVEISEDKIKEDLDKLTQKLADIKELKDTFGNDTDGYTVKTIAAFDLLRKYTIEGREKESDLKERQQAARENVNKIKRHVLFFAQVADADSAQSIKTVLEAYTLPAVSFFEKRDNSRHWFISAYLGVSAAEPDDGSNSVHGEIFAPIGLEYAWGAPDMWLADSLSIMVAPFDFGYPVNLKLKGEEKEVDYDEIISPSISVNFGVKDAPISWGFVYQRGRAYDGSGQQEYRSSFHISFDMPLHVF